ncbi:hypothetical protein RCL_jg21629.t1 [Rhizophagus clarus]|uniref:Uncharacterized protein n=1 Tax=Rhizophagus clarus TaxID=94130 RepID=A0A8H3QGD7_9GLOM|nr:hypothetical protein RCL_jg21629.t1 [Rhizophagus clarus]
MTNFYFEGYVDSQNKRSHVSLVNSRLNIQSAQFFLVILILWDLLKCSRNNKLEGYKNKLSTDIKVSYGTIQTTNTLKMDADILTINFTRILKKSSYQTLYTRPMLSISTRFSNCTKEHKICAENIVGDNKPPYVLISFITKDHDELMDSIYNKDIEYQGERGYSRNNGKLIVLLFVPQDDRIVEFSKKT